MRIALLYPEVYDMARFREGRREFPPFGVLYLAAAVREAGHAVSVIKVVKDQAALDLEDFDAVGISLASSATYGILLDARRRATLKQDALLMVGGVHANFYPQESLDDFEADIVSFGESDETILEMIRRAATRDFTGIPGVMWRDSAGVLQRREPVPVGKDISHLPLPARDLLDVEDFVMSDRLAGRTIRMAHAMFSRGCPFPCSFCAAGRTRIQYRNGESARRELIELIESYGVEGFAIVDDNFIVNKSKVHDICDSIADLNLSWSALSRVDTIDTPLLENMARSGCIEIKFGVESGSEQLLRAMRKNTTRAEIAGAVNACVDVGIEAKAFIIHGYPGENAETTRETLSLLEELGPKISRVSLFRFVPLPGTQVYDEAISNGIRGTHHRPDWDGDWEKFHIHHNDRHWWGSEHEFDEMQQAYVELENYVSEHWGPQSGS